MTNRVRVWTALRQGGSLTVMELGAVVDRLTWRQISSALAGLKKAGLVERVDKTWNAVPVAEFVRRYERDHHLVQTSPA